MKTETQATVTGFLPVLSLGGMIASLLTCKNQEEKKWRVKQKKYVKARKTRKKCKSGKSKYW